MTITFTRFAAAAFVATGLLSHTPAQAHGNAQGEETAIRACLSYNEHTFPAQLVKAVDDGMGDTLVWLEAGDELWMCNANADGDIYFNVSVDMDLLEGGGVYLVGWQEGGFDEAPELAAERLCVAVVEDYTAEGAFIVSTVDDGYGDYLVWLEGDDGNFWACNASTDGVLYALVNVDYPINA